MDYYNQQDTSQQGNQSYQEYHPPFRNPGLGMASASLFLGVAALFSTVTLFIPLLCGGLAIVFALLSKGYGKKMLTQAKIGLGCGLGSIGITIALFISSFVMLFTNPDILVELGQQYDATCETIYGQSSEELFGFSFEDMFEEYAGTLRQ